MDGLTWIYGLKFISLWSMTLWMHGAMCFNAGAPASTCLGHHTSHNGIMPQTVPVPFQVKLSSETYLPSQNISVTLASTNNGTFKGFLIVAHRTVGDKEKAIGTIIEYPTQKTKVQRCVYDEKTVLTHINNDTVHEIQFIWNAPYTDQGDLHFKYMVAVDFETFWFDQTSPILKSATQKQYIPPHVEQESFDIPDINWSSCGITKGCFLYPKTCTGNDCTAAVTYRPEGGNFIFEMFVSGQEQVAVGFSSDKKMGADHVHACTGAYGKLSVQEGYNPFTYYMRNYRVPGNIQFFGKGGMMTTKQDPGNFERLTIFKPDVVFVNIGGNDISSTSQPADIANNICKLVSSLKNNGAETIYVAELCERGIFKKDPELSKKCFNAQRNKINILLSRNSDLRLVKLNMRFPKDYADDKVHFRDPAGLSKFYYSVKRVLLQHKTT